MAVKLRSTNHRVEDALWVARRHKDKILEFIKKNATTIFNKVLKKRAK